MPLCTVTLISLHPTNSDPLLAFLSTLRTSNINPLVVSRVIRWIILPTHLSTNALLAQNIHWDLLLILPSVTPLPGPIQKLVQHEWSIVAGIPSRLVQGFHERNEKLLHPASGTVPDLSINVNKEADLADSSQNLELSPDLQSWIHSLPATENGSAISMLNLLSFKPGMKPSYLKYGAAFAESIGSKRGGNAKIVGTVVGENGSEKKEGDGGWDEVALAHYPSLLHFEEMLASKDYQDVNREFRIPALKDTFILCTSEVGIAEMMGAKREGARL